MDEETGAPTWSGPAGHGLSRLDAVLAAWCSQVHHLVEAELPAVDGRRLRFQGHNQLVWVLPGGQSSLRTAGQGSHTHTHTRPHTHTDTQIHTDTDTHPNTHTHTHRYTPKHTHTHTHTHTQIYTHTHRHTHLVGCFSHELLGRHLPDGRNRDDPPHISVGKVAAHLVTELLQGHSCSGSEPGSSAGEDQLSSCSSRKELIFSPTFRACSLKKANA